MKNKILNTLNLLQNMGLRYVSYRVKHELLKKSGLLKNRFPTSLPYQQYITLAAWKSRKTKFFFDSALNIDLPKRRDKKLSERVYDIKNGKLLLFNSLLVDLGTNYDWVTNPDSKHKYDKNKHWTEIADYSKQAGDIKYVWEKSRFSYLYDIIRYDYHHEDDSSKHVFADIASWIKANPINCGPNYRCSQEMSLRVLNWLFALHYYENSTSLTEEIFNQMQYVIYWHLHHIFNNIDFSRIAVRNNHAITETLTLFLAGLLLPTMPGAEEWKIKGKEWFEEEIAYQIYEDGTFLQYSMNYHRIVIQLLTWGIVLSEKNGERFSNTVYDRAEKSVKFLRTAMVDENGWLPNYGANDGALFFGLSYTHYRDYRPQIQALAAALGINLGFQEHYEDQYWYGIQSSPHQSKWQPAIGAHSYNQGGYYIIRERDTLTFIKCGSYKDRPSQADNLHIDIWHKGQNLLTDAGSYKYNTDAETIRYFSGTRAHNTVMLGNNDQMLKGGRFIWYYWTQSLAATLTTHNDKYEFTGKITAFRHIAKGITHQRTITKLKDIPEWHITDEIANKPAGVPINQLWHIPIECSEQVYVVSTDNNKVILQSEVVNGWYSSLYGQKEHTKEIFFGTDSTVINTVIQLM